MQRRQFLETTLRGAAASMMPAMMEKTARSTSQNSQTKPRPNMLIAMADDWSFGHAGAYACRWVKTPNFDRIARGGLLFTHAYTPNAKCAPSRAALLTGRNPWLLKAAANHTCVFPPEFKTYPEALSEKGYFVGKTGKGWGPGKADNAAGKPRQMAGRSFDTQTTTPPTPAINRNDYAANFASFLETAPKNQPWCFWYGSTEPHRTYEFGSGAAQGGKKISDIERVPGFWPDNETVRNDMLDYAFEVEYFDRHLGRMLEMLEDRGLAENTLVVVTSDNGMPFPHNKGQAYHDSNHLPLAIRWPRGIKRPGRVVPDYISFIDLAPTIIELAGLPWPQTGMAPAMGRSLTDIFQTEKDGQAIPSRDHVLIGKERNDVGRPNDEGYPIRGIIKGGMLYLYNFEAQRWPGGNPETGYLDCDGSPTKTEVLKSRTNPQQKHLWDACFGKRRAEELYDLDKDPDCLQNLIGDAEYRGRAAQLQKLLFQELREQQDPRVWGQGRLFDQYPYGEEGMRGFYERYLRGEKVKAGWVNPSDFEIIP